MQAAQHKQQHVAVVDDLWREDVKFEDCLATEAWKTTLAQAIRYASPLPAPPDATVFSDEISLEF